MKDALYQIDLHVRELSQVIIDKKMNNNYALESWDFNFEDDELEFTFFYNDHTCDSHFENVEIYSLDILNMDIYDFVCYLDKLAEQEFQKQILRRKKQNEELARKEAEREDQEYQHYLELKEIYEN